MRQRELFDLQPQPWELDNAADQLVARIVFSSGAQDKPFDYLVPDGLRGQVAAGRRVRVPLGRGNRTVVGYCVGVQQAPAAARPLKPIQAVVDAGPLLSPAMLQLTQWMSAYYLCPWGRVLEAVVPAGVRTQAGTRAVTLLSVPTSVAARLTQFKLPPRQAQALACLAASPRPLTPPQLAAAAGCTLAPIRQLRAKGLVQAQVSRVAAGAAREPAEPRTAALPLNPAQQAALDAIRQVLHAGQHRTLLLHGVTGSGKTEVYIQAIQEVIRHGRQAIVLVPEISLTPQTRRRFRSRFDQVAVLHSHLSDAERHAHWQRIVRGEVQVVVGARSAVFAPTPHLGLIVVDEEHDASFKQDAAPRYDARTVAAQRAAMEQVPLVLGSATPSLESWHQAREGGGQLLELPRRVSDRPLPDVVTVDLRAEFRNRKSRGAISRPLHQAIDQALRDGGQVILLLNRRGYATHIQCPACGQVVRCPHCDLALTHHRQGELVVCHYCDYQKPTPPQCPGCGFGGIRFSGLGTQKLEAEVRARFPRASCQRMDSDSMQRPGSHEEALARFRSGQVDILLGTQMIAKGLDFPNVTLVGVVNADTALHLPDFRAAERTYQLVTQVAGRTGRGDKGGRVLVQTFSPEHPAIVAAGRHDYERFAAGELPVRRASGFPPYAALVRLIVRGSSETAVQQFSQQAVEALRQPLAGADFRLLGPAPAPLAKIRGQYRFHALLCGPDRDRLRQAVQQAVHATRATGDLQWVVDIDPLEML